MTEIPKEENPTLAQSLERLRDLASDGFQWGDLPRAAKLLIDEFHDLTADGEGPKAQVVEALNTFIDQTDTPWLPDSVSDPVMKMLVPGIVDTIWEAARERLFQTPPAEEKA